MDWLFGMFVSGKRKNAEREKEMQMQIETANGTSGSPPSQTTADLWYNTHTA